MSGLPAGWVEVDLDSVGLITTGSTPSTQKEEYYGGLVPFVKPGDLDKCFEITSTRQMLTQEGSEQGRLLRAGAVLVSCIGNLGKVGIAGVPVVTNQQINAVEFHENLVNKRYGYHYCKTLRPWMEQEASATTIVILNKGRFSRAPFILAPINEQKRIAEKLDALLERLNTCREKLDLVPLILKRFRHAVLAAATSGGLTEDWRQQQNRQYDWVTKFGRDIFPYVTSGSRGWAAYYSNSGSKFIRIGNLDHETIKIDLTKIQYVAPPAGAEGVRTQVKVGDILISITADVGMVGFVNADIGTAYINQHICLARQTGEYVGAYLAYYLASPTGGLTQLTEAQRGATKAGLTLGDIRNLEIWIPKTDEQHEIVRRVEKLFAFADRLEARYTTGRTQIDQLTPSLLAKAFRGELVEQDPNDEPAEKLLERIRTTKAGSAPSRRAPAPRATRPVKEPVCLEPIAPLPLVAKPTPVTTRNIPQAILAAMKTGSEYTRSDILNSTGIKESDWLWAIKQLKTEGKVVQVGEKRGAKYHKPT